MKCLHLLIFAVLFIGCKKEKTNSIYQTDSYKLYHDRVNQGDFNATAHSRKHIESNYYTDKIVLEFKFSINGDDNESGWGMSRRIRFDNDFTKFTTDTFVFGKDDTLIHDYQAVDKNPENKSTTISFQLDMNQVIETFKQDGYFITFKGDTIFSNQFNGVYISGPHENLGNWNWKRMKTEDTYKLQDKDNDGIYSITLDIDHKKSEHYKENWKLSAEISNYPNYKSDYLLSDALYNMSLEETMLNIRDDSTFMAGEKWKSVWTRDLSSSLILSLAIIDPEIAQKSMLNRIKNGLIIQDSGTGGSWPVSTDRVIWAVAAWELYCITGNKEWLANIYPIVKKTLDADRKVALGKNGLFYGETASMDWREQSYPKWMNAGDIYKSQATVTNCIHYMAYQALIKMGSELDKEINQYKKNANSLKEAINTHLWMPEKGYYGMYLYGKAHSAICPRSEAMGQALAILSGIASPEKQMEMTKKVPVLTWGISDFYPQIPNIRPYHNDGIWPFIEAYWMLASAKAENEKSVLHIIASLYRQSALFLTNKENFVANSGDAFGTFINSNRQLWSVAGNLSIVYKLFFGLNYHPGYLEFKPFVPKKFKGTKSLTNLKYRNSILNITIEGHGNQIASITLDGNNLEDAKIPSSLSGEHDIHITLANNDAKIREINLVDNYYAPETPEIKMNGDKIQWGPIENAREYLVFRNGKQHNKTIATKFLIQEQYDTYTKFQVASVDENGVESFLSEPVLTEPDATITVEAENAKTAKATTIKGEQCIHILPDSTTRHEYRINVPQKGRYLLSCHYINEGSYQSGISCAVRSVYINNVYQGALVLPINSNEGSNWEESPYLVLELSEGKQTLKVKYEDFNENMHEEKNEAYINSFMLHELKNEKMKK